MSSNGHRDPAGTRPARLRIPTQVRGPRDSGNGGWTCGVLAELMDPTLPGAVRVRLSVPPPLETDLLLTRFTVPDGSEDASGLRLSHGPTTVAEAMVLAGPDRDLEPVPPQDDDPDVAFELAQRAGERYGGLTDHPFPECFACGTARAEGDGLLLRPGPVGDATTSTAWVPHPAFDVGDGAVRLATTWAGLDCPGGWSADLPGRPMVLGTMTAQVLRRPRIGERCVVRGSADLTGRTTGRRTVPARTTLYGADGQALAIASQIWVVIAA